MRIFELDIKDQKKLFLMHIIDMYMEEEPTGGSCHALLDDGNYGGDYTEQAKDNNDYVGFVIAELLNEFTEEEQEQMLERSWEVYEELGQYFV